MMSQTADEIWGNKHGPDQPDIIELLEREYAKLTIEPKKKVAALATMPKAGIDLLKQMRNDVGNGQRLIARHGEVLKYCPAFEKFYGYDGRRWLLDERKSDRARDLAQRTIQEYLIQAVRAGSEDHIKFAAGSLNSQRLTNCLREAQPHLLIQPAELDSHVDLLNFTNGTVDLRTGAMGPHQREHFITKLVHHNYRADADCPTFLSFLAKATEKHPGLLTTGYLQKALGYSLTARTIEKLVFFVYGPTDTGKTTWLSLIRKLLGDDYATLIQIDSIMARQHELSTNAQADLAALRGMRFAMTSETKSGQRLSEGEIKRICQGMGRIKAVRKYENPFEFAETHKLWADANHLPDVRDTDDSIWNRLHAIPFDTMIPKAEQDRELPAKLAAEGEGILAWAVAGAVRWYAEGLGKPKAVENAAGRWRAQSDQVGRFIRECYVAKKDAQVKARALYSAYKAWAEGAGEPAIAEFQFGQRMAEMRSFAKVLTRTGAIYQGIAAKE